MNDRWVRAAEALLPPGDAVVECIGAGAGANPDVVAVALLAGIVAVEVAAFLAFGDVVPPTFLLLFVIVIRPLFLPARGLVVTQHGRWLSAWRLYRGVAGPLEPAGLITLDPDRRSYFRIPVKAADVTLWLTPGQMRRLAAAGVPLGRFADPTT